MHCQKVQTFGNANSMDALQDFREPLYLTDIPVQLEDKRSAEEKKYPELFRHKLQGDTMSLLPEYLPL